MASLAIASVVAGTFLVSQAGKSHEETGHIAAGQLGRVLILSIAASVFPATSLIAGQVATPVNGEFEVTWLARVFAVTIVLPFFAVRSMRGTAPFK